MRNCVSVPDLNVQAKMPAIFEGENSKQKLLREEFKHVEDWMCSLREMELGNLFDEIFFIFEVLHLSK